MDKRKTSLLSHDGKVSQAYLHERSILQKRLDQFQREQEKSIRKISNRQETLANSFAAEISKNQGIETAVLETSSLGERSQTDINSSLDSEGPGGMEIYPPLRKASVPHDIRYRKLSSSAETRSTKKAIRQTSDPLQSSSQTGEDSKVIISFPRRKLTTGQIDLAVSSKVFHHQSGNSELHIFKGNLSKNQNRPSSNFLSAKLPSELVGRHLITPLSNSKSERGNSMGKMNFSTRLFSSANTTPSRMVNETGREENSKYIKDSLINVSKKVLDERRKSSHENSACFQQEPKNDITKPRESRESKITQKITPGDVVTKGQFQNTEANSKDVYLSRELSITELKTPDKSFKRRDFNKSNSKSDIEAGSEIDKSDFRKGSLSGDKSKRHLHALTSSTTVQQAGAVGGVCRLGNGWTDNNIVARRKISTVKAPEGILINDNSSGFSSKINVLKEQSSVGETGRNIDALKSFRRLALVAVAAERFRAKAPASNFENHRIALPERKLSTKARLAELQRPTESYLRQTVAEETFSKTPNAKTISGSWSGSHSGKTSVSGITNFRRVSQTAMATRILIDRKHRKVSGSGFSGIESRKEPNQGKTLAEMMEELKNCRYLRNSTVDDE